jgi:hypothetical protein
MFGRLATEGQHFFFVKVKMSKRARRAVALAEMQFVIAFRNSVGS